MIGKGIAEGVSSFQHLVESAARLRILRLPAAFKTEGGAPARNDIKSYLVITLRKFNLPVCLSVTDNTGDLIRMDIIEQLLNALEARLTDDRYASRFAYGVDSVLTELDIAIVRSLTIRAVVETTIAALDEKFPV